MKTCLFSKLGRILATGLLASTFVEAAPALVISIVNPDRNGFPGDVETFSGTITNNTGFALDSTDLFLNFSGYDPVNVQLDQDLGSTSFTIGDGTTTSLVDLFTFTLSGTTPPGTYPADVVLEDAAGDLSAPVTVVLTITPEPASVLLVGLGLLTVFALSRLKQGKALVLMLCIAAAGIRLEAQVSLVTAAPGVTQAGSAQPLMIALPITNSGTSDATSVLVTSATLRSATLLSPSAFPATVGTITVGSTAVFQANFSATALVANTNYLLTIRGTYVTGGATLGFTVNRFIQLPPASPSSGTSTTISVGPGTVSGAPYPSQIPVFDDDVNENRPPVPTGPFVPGTPTPNSTAPQSFGNSGTPQANVIRPNASVGFSANNSLGLTGGNTIAEPSGAVSGSVVFATTNVSAALSTNSGSSFTQLNPTNIFPNDAIGFCCDQIVQYVPSIDRFIWVLQGSSPNGYRVASASTAQVNSGGGKAWTYWNLAPTLFGQPSGTGFDYPDVSVGNNYLYISWDVGFPACPSGCNSGHQVVRIPLSQIQAGGTINIGYTNPKDAGLAWGSHLSQDTGDTIFWAGHNNTSNIRVFSWAESTGTYFWRDIGLSSWSNTGISSKTPDNQDWMNKLSGFPGTAVIGATRSGNSLWLAWSAGTDSNFHQPHIEMVTLGLANNFNKIQQVQIWNNSFAFGYPALATNACTGEVGLSLEIGGGGSYENHAVGFWGDFLVYTTTNSNVGTTRYGDYVSIRQDNAVLGGAYFDAWGYGLNSVNGGGTTIDIHYVAFGRPGGCVIN